MKIDNCFSMFGAKRLKANLADYTDYIQRVPAGLFPRLTRVRAAALVLVGLAVLAAGFLYAVGTNSTAGLKPSPSSFNEQRAFENLKQFTELGPRPPGSGTHDSAYLLIYLGLLAAGVDIHNVSFDGFEASTPVGKIQMTNVVAKIPGAQPDTIILGGHYDTKRLRLRFVGANDGGSSRDCAKAGADWNWEQGDFIFDEGQCPKIIELQHGTE